MSMLLLGVGGAGAAPPSYWLVFDGTNDYIALPSSHGQEPSTAIFIEAWIKDVPAGARCIITRGDFYESGYSFTPSQADDTTWLSYRLALKDVEIEGPNVFPYAALDLSLPTHVAAGWDGTTAYYFVNGMLVAEKAMAGTIGYSGNLWTIGDMQQSGAVWPFSGKMSQLRVSNVCRHTASFVPPTTFTTDANTIGLWLAQEGAGTTLGDSSANAHDGVFKGAGEPAWGDAIDLTKLSYGDDMWDALAAVVPAVTNTNIYLHRTSADQYEVYRKVHATGPYWAKWVYGRVPQAGLMPVAGYTGVPDPATDVPSDWTTDPATRLLEPTTEWVFWGTEVGSVEEDFGSGHNTNEQLTSEGWTVDGAATVLADDGWANGSVIKYTANTYYVEPTTSHTVCNMEKIHTYDKAIMWVDREYTFDWLYDWEPGVCLPLMASFTAANLDRCTYVPGGTDIDTAGADTDSDVRSNACALWDVSGEEILAIYADFEDGLRYMASDSRNYVNTGFYKLYFQRSTDLHSAQAGDSWHYHTRYLALDNCGNHFLKTT